MVANFAIHNNNNPRGRRHETVRKLAKNVLKKPGQKERDIKQVFETQQKEYITKEYIPAEVVIFNLCARTCQTTELKEKLDFLNNKAAVKNLSTAPKKIYNQGNEEEYELFNIELDDTNNIFAA